MATKSSSTTTATTMAAEFRDKRYAGRALIVDLHDAECEATAWTIARFTLTDGPRALLEGLHGREILTGVFSFEGTPDHGLFEAEIEELDRERGRLVGRFVWTSERGRKLLDRSMRRPLPPMNLGFARVTFNWSFTGLLLGGYRGALKDGAQVRGMIWTDDPNDPGLFVGHAVTVNAEKHTLAIKFDALPDGTFALLEAAMKKHDVGFSHAATRAQV